MPMDSPQSLRCSSLTCRGYTPVDSTLLVWFEATVLSVSQRLDENVVDRRQSGGGIP